MKYFLFIALLPCILAAEIQNAVCLDGTQCAAGKYCCELPDGKPGCCELSKELQDKGYAPALPSSTPNNASLPEPQAMNAPCFGTQCGLTCIPNIFNGVCCSNPRFACPQGTRCCSNSYSEQPWCCLRRTRCSSIRGLCINSAVTPSTAMMSLLFAFMIGMLSKHFL